MIMSYCERKMAVQEDFTFLPNGGYAQNCFSVLEVPMMFSEYDTVKIIKDSANGAKRGDIGTILMVFSEPSEAYEVEIANEDGTSRAQYTMRPNELEHI